MRTTLLAAVAAFSLASGVAYAADANSGYVYPNFWGDAPAQQVPAAKAPAQSHGASISTYVTQSSHGTWLFPPNPNGGNG